MRDAGHAHASHGPTTASVFRQCSGHVAVPPFSEVEAASFWVEHLDPVRRGHVHRAARLRFDHELRGGRVRLPDPWCSCASC